MQYLMRKDTPDEWGVKELQNVILNIASDVDSFCCKRNIGYRLMGGSALGAKRHGGFIPWDDDLDIFMTPDEYEIFRDAFFKEGNRQKYYLQEYGASNGKLVLGKIRLNNSYLEEEIVKDWRIHQGIYIDIFILHTCPNSIIQRYWQYFWAKYIIVKGLANKNYRRRGKIIYLLMNLMKFLPKRFLLDFALNQVYAYRHKKTNYFCNYLGKALMKNGTYKYDYFSNIKRVPFETIELNVAGALEDFLRDRFGDYMRIPSLERIKYEQHATTWALGDYKYEDTSDERFLIS